MDGMSPPDMLGSGAGDADLDVVRDEPSLRLGCLELYVRLSGPSETSRTQQSKISQSFVVEEDKRQRVLVHWAGAGEADEDEGARANASTDNYHFQSWRVSCAFSPCDSDAALFETLGLETVEWLWDGLSALVLSLAPRTEASSSSALLLGSSDTPSRGLESRGLLGYCLQELCRRVAANPDPRRFCLGISLWELWGSQAEDLLAADDEDASNLRFETVQIESAEDALKILDVVGLAEAASEGSRDIRGPLPSCCRQCGNVFMADALFCRHCGVKRQLEKQMRSIFVRVVVFDANRQSLAALHFAQIASCFGNEVGAVDIASDRQALWNLLEAASTGDAVRPRPGCRLSEVLAPLVAGNCKPFLLCTVPERPRDSEAAAEAHSLLDLVERASLITAQCTRVQGIRREEFRLAEFETTLGRLRQRSRDQQWQLPETRISGEPTTGLFGASSNRESGSLLADPHRRSLELVQDVGACQRSLEHRFPASKDDDVVVCDERSPSPEALSFTDHMGKGSSPTPTPSPPPSASPALLPFEVGPAATGRNARAAIRLPWKPEATPGSAEPAVQKADISSSSSRSQRGMESSSRRVSQALGTAPGNCSSHRVERTGAAEAGRKRGQDATASPTAASAAAAREVDQQHKSTSSRRTSGKDAVARAPGACPATEPVTQVAEAAAARRQAAHQQAQTADEAAILKECQELGAACAALRAKNMAKAARRRRELEEVQAEIASLHKDIEHYEDQSDARELLQAFRKEAQALRSQVENLREENAALSGSRGEERRLAAQRAILPSLQQEAAKLRACAAEAEKGEKRSHLVHRCLQEVRGRLDIAKGRQAEMEREISELRPSFAELGRQIEVAERERRWVHGELDKLRRASTGLRAEICQLREVRGAIDSLPPPEEDLQSGGTDSVVGSSAGVERFATLQRRLAAVAPQLVPLCSRARAEMEELVQCCNRLEQRQKRLQQVAYGGTGAAAVAGDDLDLGSVSVGSARRPQRARSSDTVVSSARGASAAASGTASTADQPGAGRGQQRRAGGLSRSPLSAETLGTRSARSTPRGSRAQFASPSASTLGTHRESDLAGAQGDKEAKPSASSTCCPQCGNTYMADSLFCRHCGQKRELDQDRQAGPATNTSSREPSPRMPPSATPLVASGSQSNQRQGQQASGRPQTDAAKGYAKAWATRGRSQDIAEPRPSPRAVAEPGRLGVGYTGPPGVGIQSTAGTLHDLGLHVTPGTSACVRGVHLVPDAKKSGGHKTTSRDRTPPGISPAAHAASSWKSPRGRTLRATS
eukprot:TRINITY_DN31351_c0_g1_i2.p1 TRINITY_DN31351_c0_g1~~TRINITY_DN31351_c0_g1_i2.p1  ORF type:complete len:1287 (+),score=224.88 TRINITY_DN31351_c0_g1_i2:66-3926(+)